MKKAVDLAAKPILPTRADNGKFHDLSPDAR
jgi:hypothetical protein